MIHPFTGQVEQYYTIGRTKLSEKEFDVLNRKILYLLYQNSRYSPTQQAKILKVNRETILYRIKKMREDKILNGFVALLNHEALGLREYRVFFKLKTIGEEKSLIPLLFSLRTVVTINICTGSYDLVVAFWVKNDREFQGEFQQIIDHFHHLITLFDVVIGLERNSIGMRYLLNKDEFISPNRLQLHKGATFLKELWQMKQSTEKYTLDAIDIKILKRINLHAEMPLHQLSRELSLSLFVVKKRMKEMIKAGVIKHFFPIVSVSKLGYHWWYVLIKCTKLNHASFLTYISQHQNISWYIHLLGKWDYQISVYARDNAECHKVIAELRTTFANHIVYYEVLVVFTQLKYIQRIE